jgi:NitT/TauT family transport system substrate-binding protein
MDFSMYAFRSIGLAFAVIAAAMSLSDSALAQTAVRFLLDTKLEGPAAPLFVAIDKGYFKAEGLDVTIEPAESNLDPLKRVAAGDFDIGLGDFTALMKFLDAKPASAVRAVFMFTNRPAFAVISRKSRGVEKPKDLEDKTLGAPPGDASFAAWPIFAQANGIDPGKVKIENISVPVREPMLQNGQVDAVTGRSYSAFINLKAMGVPSADLVLMLMADYGVNLYGDAVLVNTKFASEKPDAVKGFLRALAKAMRDTVKNPAAAVESVVKRSDALQKAIELERLEMAIRQGFLTPEVKANGYGAVDPDRLGQSIEQIGQSFAFKNKAKAAEAFDGGFLPPAADRKAN